MTVLELKGFQKKYLKKLAHDLSPVISVGVAGLSEPVIKAIKDILLKKELIKIRLLQTDNKQELAQKISEVTNSFLCGIIGHIVILYHPNKEKNIIQLPERS